MPPAAPNTLAELRDRVIRTFPRANQEIEEILFADLDAWLSRLSRTYPYWFLCINPGDIIPQAFPIQDLGDLVPLHGAWVDRGWLRLEEGVEAYTMAAPLEDSEAGNSSFWQPARIQQLNWVKRFSEAGNFQADLEIFTTNEMFSFKSYERYGRPVACWWETRENHSVLRIHPIPDTHYLLAVSFYLAESPSYADGAQMLNRWTTYAPEAAYHYCMWKLAEYFDESDIAGFHERQLFGDPPRKDHAGIQNFQGILGDLQRESQRRSRQATRDIPIYTSIKTSIGRAGFGRPRSPRPGFYIGPNTYP